MELTDRLVPTSGTRNWYSPGGTTVFPRRASTGRVSLPWKVSWPDASGPVPASAASPSKATIPSESFEPNLFSSVFISFLLFEFFDGHTGSAKRASRFICSFEQDRVVLGQDALPGGSYRAGRNYEVLVARRYRANVLGAYPNCQLQRLKSNATNLWRA